MAFAQILADGEYTIQSKVSNVFCGFAGSIQRGTPFQVSQSYYDSNGLLTADGSVFVFTSLGNNVYTIKNKKSGLLLDASGAGTSSGTILIQWDANGGDNQKWKVSLSTNGSSYCITGLASGRRVDLSGAQAWVGNKLILWNQNNQYNQNYSLIKNSPPVIDASVATFYSDANYGGTAVSLPVGDYTLTDLLAKGILNNDISALKVTAGYSVKLFFDDNWLGATMESTTNVDTLANGFNNQVTSITIHKDFLGIKAVDLYENCYYTGRWISLPVGSYTAAQLAEAGMPGKTMFSFRLLSLRSSGISASYIKDEGTSPLLPFISHFALRADGPCLTNNLIPNNIGTISSLVVFPSNISSRQTNDFKLTEENTADLYPNPNSGSVTVNNLTGKSTIEIYNSLGLKIFETNTAGLATSETINTGAFFSGVYFIKVSGDDNKEATYKMIKN